MRCLRSLTAAAAVTLASAVVVPLAQAQPKPTVSGPDDGRSTRGVTLPGPGTRVVLGAIEVDFEGDCLERSELAKGVARWLEQERVNNRITISVTGEEQPALGARFWLLIDGQRASLRRFEEFSGTCEELSSSLSAAIALAIEAVDLAEFPEPPVQPKPILPVARLTARSPLNDVAPPVPLPPPPRRRAGVVQSAALGAQLLGGVGVAPTSAAGFGVRGEIGFVRSLAARVGANYWVGTAASIADGEVAVRALALQSGACWAARTTGYGAQVCLDAWFGAMTGRPENLDRATTATLPWFALAPAAEVRYQASEELGVLFGAQLSFNLVRPRFEVLFSTRDEPLDNRAVPPLGLIGTLGMDWSLL